MYVLQKLPNIDVIPADEFKSGSHDQFKKTMAAVKVDKMMAPVHIQQWEQFAQAVAPKDDDVNAYLVEHPNAMYIPFKDILFGEQIVDQSIAIPIAQPVAEKRVIPTIEATASVMWSNRGDPSERNHRPVAPLIQRSSGQFCLPLFA